MFNRVSISIILILTFFGVSAHAKDIKYPVSAIPDSLLKNAKSVVRESILEFEVINLNRCIKNEKLVITILDRSGEEEAYGYYTYDDERQIQSISATVYSKSGTKLETYSRKDFKDMSMDAFGSIYSDSRYLYHRGASSVFPYTIEYEVTYEQSYSYLFPFWMPQSAYDQSLENAELIVKVPNKFGLKFRENKIQSPVRINETDELTVYSWELNSLPAIAGEPFTPQRHLQFPNVELSPLLFKFDNYTGSMQSWNTFGKFFYELNKGRNDISDELHDEVVALVRDINDPIEKIRVLYQFMQDRTRYVSIQVGIGGIQPFPASSVEEYGYGDCKALSNFMMAILSAAGIESFYSLIDAGTAQYYLDTNFVSDPFNHVILNIPFEGKELWLECTSQISPFGFLGDFTDNRFALVITEIGGILKKTPNYGLENNTTHSIAEVIVNEDGHANAKVQTTFRGLSYDKMMGVLHMSYEKQKDYLYDQKLDIADFKIKTFSYRDMPQQLPEAVETLDLELVNYASVSGSRMFIPINLMNRFDYIPPRDKNRETAIALKSDISECDTVSFFFPEDYSIEHCPKGDTVVSEFGKLVYTVEDVGNGIRYIRNFELYNNTYPKECYNNLVKFCRAITKADKQKLVLVKK